MLVAAPSQHHGRAASHLPRDRASTTGRTAAISASLIFFLLVGFLVIAMRARDVSEACSGLLRCRQACILAGSDLRFLVPRFSGLLFKRNQA